MEPGPASCNYRPANEARRVVKELKEKELAIAHLVPLSRTQTQMYATMYFDHSYAHLGLGMVSMAPKKQISVFNYSRLLHTTID